MFEKAFKPLRSFNKAILKRVEKYVDIKFWRTFTWYYTPDFSPKKTLDRLLKRNTRLVKPEVARFFPIGRKKGDPKRTILSRRFPMYVFWDH